MNDSNLFWKISFLWSESCLARHRIRNMKIIIPIFLLFVVIVVGSGFETNKTPIGISNLDRNAKHQQNVSVPAALPSKLENNEEDMCRKPIRKLDPPAESDSTETSREQDASYRIPSMQLDEFLLLV